VSLILSNKHWGVAKFQYHMAPRASTLKGMEASVKECLDSISGLQIQQPVCVFPVMLHLNIMVRFANQSVHFIFAYGEG
jgi:hypothetical protein